MKKNILTILVLMLPNLLLADVSKGQTYYKYILKPIVNIKGDKFTKQYTKKEWKEFFSNDADKFKKLLLEKNQKANKLIESNKFNKIKPHIKDFFIFYSKDSKNIATCSE